MDKVQLATGGHTCPACEAGHMTVQRERDEFEYGNGEDAVVLSAYIPIHKCDACGFEYVDDHGMQIRHEAVCRHLGLLTPTDIKRIRVQLRCSQKSFAELTGIGVASISRWEAGSLLQNRSHDNLLRLYEYPDNVERAKQWAEQANKLAVKDVQFSGRGLNAAAVQKLLPSQDVFSLRKFG